jgi:hypothetical protein
MVQRRAERLRDEPQRVEEVALPRAVCSDKESDGTEPDVAARDAAIVSERDSRDERSHHHFGSIAERAKGDGEE